MHRGRYGDIIITLGRHAGRSAEPQRDSSGQGLKLEKPGIGSIEHHRGLHTSPLSS
jgi:hypothetical protein